MGAGTVRRMDAKLLLIRHAVTSWHGQSRVLGQNDVPLDDEGHSQARTLARALSGIRVNRILSSPLMRATQTAGALGEQFRLPVTPEPRLTDLRVGEWEGLTFAELARREDYRRFLDEPLGVRIPGGETLE